MGRVNQRKVSEYDERLQRALKTLGSVNNPITVGEAAEEYEVNKRTLYRRIAGTHESRVISHQEQQRLTPAEESVIVKWCEEQDDRGFPPRLDMVRSMAIVLEEKRSGTIAAPLGQKWISRFLNRHPTLASKLSCNLERQRAYANDPRLLQDNFGKLGRLMRCYGLKGAQIFNMDEKGFLMGQAARAKVICRRGRRNPRVTHDGKRELVSVIETVSGSGIALSPFIINKGKGHYLGWYRNLTEAERTYHFSYSLKGWTDNDLAMRWLRDLFDPESALIAGVNQPRLLILDGHGSHISFEFIQYCIDSGIHLICLPAHSTHLLQPLDVGLFSPYQHFYGLAVDNHIRSGQSQEGIRKAVFIPFLTEACTKTMTSHSIQQAFTATGIWPLNLRRVLGKLAPPPIKQLTAIGVSRNPQTAWDIRGKVKAGKRLLDIGFMGLEDTKVDLKGTGEIRHQVVGILRELGHQLETAIAEKELYQESNRHLQGTSKLFNTTDRRQLSVARVLNGAELMRLRDARLTKDAKKALRLPVSRKTSTPKRKPTKPPPIPRTPPIIVQEIVISNTPIVMFIDPEVEESEDEQLSENE